MSIRKPRGDSKLDALTPDQREQLCSWLTVENLTYAKAQAQLKQRFGISTTRSALCSFFASVAAPWKYAQARGEADSFAGLMEGKFDEASIKRAKQLAFEAMTTPASVVAATCTVFPTSDFVRTSVGFVAPLIAAQRVLRHDCHW